MNAILEAMPFEFSAGEGEAEMRRPASRGAPGRSPRPAPARRAFAPTARPAARRVAARPVLRASSPRYRTTVLNFPTYDPFATPLYPAPLYPAPQYAAPTYAAPPEAPAAEPAAMEPQEPIAMDDAGAMDNAALVEAGEFGAYRGNSGYGGYGGYGANAPYSPYSPYSRYPTNQQPAASGSPYLRWVQHRLNQLLGTSIRKSGVMDVASRSALLRFQRRYGLRVSGILDVATRAALRVPPVRPLVRPLYNSGYGATRGVQAEIPRPIRKLIYSSPAYAKYKSGPVDLNDIVKDHSLNLPAVYLVTFQHQGQRKAYSGMSMNLRERMVQHHREWSMPGTLDRKYMVHYTLIKAPAGLTSPTQIYKAQKKIADTWEENLNKQRAALAGILVNRTTELEAEAEVFHF